MSPAQTPHSTPAVFITGVSSGIGKAAALAFRRAGYHVIGTVRRLADGDALQQAGGTPVVLDVRQPDAIARLAESMPNLLEGRPLQAVINNAGISLCVPWQELDLDDFRTQLEVNLVGVIAVTRALLPWVSRKTGKIIMISSTAARFATAMMGPYSCSKYALEAMVETLRQELWHDGIDVISIQPGPVATPIFDKTHDWITEKYAPAFDRGVFGRFPQYAAEMGATGLAPEKVAQVIVKTVKSRRPRLRQLVSKNPMWFWFQPWIPTRLFDRVVAQALYGKRRKPRP